MKAGSLADNESNLNETLRHRFKHRTREDCASHSGGSPWGEPTRHFVFIVLLTSSWRNLWQEHRDLPQGPRLFGDINQLASLYHKIRDPILTRPVYFVKSTEEKQLLHPGVRTKNRRNLRKKACRAGRETRPNSVREHLFNRELVGATLDSASALDTTLHVCAHIFDIAD